jgi:hypothetical protein
VNYINKVRPMEAILLLIAIVGALVALDLAALRFGVDSRYGSMDSRTPARGISA